MINGNHMYFNRITTTAPEEGTLLTDTAFYTTIQLDTKVGEKGFKVTIDPGVQANTILHKIFPYNIHKSGNQKPKSPVTHPYNMGQPQQCPQPFSGQFMTNVHHIS